jgi:hypothetical protein
MQNLELLLDTGRHRLQGIPVAVYKTLCTYSVLRGLRINGKKSREKQGKARLTAAQLV